MNEVNNAAVGSSTTSEDDDLKMVDILIILAKYKKRIIGWPVVAAVIMIALSFLMPNVYQANARLLPPQQQQSAASALLSQLGGAASLAAGAAGIKNPSDLYVAMLKSRRIEDQLIKRFDLNTVYETESLEKARKALELNTVITSGKDGLIGVEVSDRDPKRAAGLANGYVDELTKLTRTLALTESSQRRMFFERQLEQAKDNLATAEVSLKKGLDAKGVISVDAESRVIVETVGRLRAQVSAKEVQLNSMRPFMTDSNPTFRRTEEELASLRAELARLENGRAAGIAGGGAGADDKGPVGLENIKLLRDVKYYQMLYELLAKQYEVARLDEAKEPTIIQVLDSAVAPERKAKPNRIVLGALAGVFALVVAVVTAFLREARARAAQSPETAARWKELRSYLSFR